MSTNLTLALIAAIIWIGTYFWYFRGTDRIKADLLNVLARLRPRRRKV